MSEDNMIKGQPCHICGKNGLTLSEIEQDIPHFGNAFILTMYCEECKYKKTDVNLETKQEPAKYTFTIENEKDLNVRIVKSSEATIKIPRMITITPGVASDGFVSNVEGLLNRITNILESTRDSEDDPSKRKKAKNQLKKLSRVLWGRENLTIEISDPSGNSAIISDKATKTKI
jgi:zinc finger protein